MQTFDATVDFENPGELESVLIDAMAQEDLAQGSFLHKHIWAAIVRCDNEVGELYYREQEWSDINEDDWIVFGTTAEELASKLRAML